MGRFLSYNIFPPALAPCILAGDMHARPGLGNATVAFSLANPTLSK